MLWVHWLKRAVAPGAPGLHVSACGSRGEGGVSKRAVILYHQLPAFVFGYGLGAAGLARARLPSWFQRKLQAQGRARACSWRGGSRCPVVQHGPAWPPEEEIVSPAFRH